MQLWMILILIVLVLWRLSLIRIGASVTYDYGGLLVKVKAGPVKITVYPMKEKDKPQKTAKRKKQPEADQHKRVEKGGNLSLVRRFLPIAADAAGHLKRKIRIDNVEFDLIWGANDPASAAMGFGWANAALGMLWPLVEHNFNVRQRQLRTAVNYNASAPAITIRATLSLNVGQGLILGAVLGIKVFKLFRSYKKEQKLKEAV